jgi:hypothetical protein
LEVEVAVETFLVAFDVLAFKILEPDVALGDDEVADHEDEEGEYASTVQVGAEHALIADAAAQDGHNFGVGGHFGGEEKCGDEDEQRPVEAEEVGDEVQVVFEDDFVSGCAVANKVVEFFGDVESDDDDDDDDEPEQEVFEVLPQYVAVYERIGASRHCGRNVLCIEQIIGMEGFVFG